MTDSETFDFKWEEKDRQEDQECKVREAIDQLFYCWTVGKQVKNIYRYGKKMDCDKYWEKLRLCSKIKLYSEEDRKKALYDYKEKTTQKKLSEPNVFDVWEKRREPLKDFPPVSE
ncbi:hypothetical protein BB559_000385 [Furculomyces boomerangus]|uniref:Uncharacterized protein n=2 Tax=Harpellales TaxID=61421 RepID=A0A2T9Z5K7_9FUNG|nr:hypothetical protein BB559_000385 [Furculomyces boomerangus]PVZ99227.1 hypothetical protein BB558_004760 [Smittium angustum]